MHRSLRDTRVALRLLRLHLWSGRRGSDRLLLHLWSGRRGLLRLHLWSVRRGSDRLGRAGSDRLGRAGSDRRGVTRRAGSDRRGLRLPCFLFRLPRHATLPVEICRLHLGQAAGILKSLGTFRIFQESTFNLKTRKPKQCLEETGSSIAILAHIPVILSNPAFAIRHGAVTGVSQTL